MLPKCENAKFKATDNESYIHIIYNLSSTKSDICWCVGVRSISVTDMRWPVVYTGF